MTGRAKQFVVQWYQRNSCDALACNGCINPLITNVGFEKGEPLLYCRSCGYRKIVASMEFWVMWKDFVSFYMYKDTILSKVLVFWALVYVSFMVAIGGLAVMTYNGTISWFGMMFLISFGLMFLFMKKAITMWSLFEALRNEQNQRHPSR